MFSIKGIGLGNAQVSFSFEISGSLVMPNVLHFLSKWSPPYLTDMCRHDFYSWAMGPIASGECISVHSGNTEWLILNVTAQASAQNCSGVNSSPQPSVSEFHRTLDRLSPPAHSEQIWFWVQASCAGFWKDLTDSFQQSALLLCTSFGQKLWNFFIVCRVIFSNMDT